VKRYGVILIVVILLAICTLTSASDRGIVRIQGVVMALDMKNKTLIVNEKLFTWDRKTVMSTEKGIPLTPEQMKTRQWVFIEGVHDSGKPHITANKIYLLPHYIREKDRAQYSFFEE
jgi:hypothetical protein